MSAAANLGFSAERLSTLDRVLSEDYVQRGDVPCAAIQVWRGGELAHAGAWGHADRESGAPIRDDSIYRIYSMTKPITGTAILMLMEDGAIDLDDDVARFIPVVPQPAGLRGRRPRGLSHPSAQAPDADH
jgi:CubicO group peptidase (beta-lactamase class C family)